MEMETALVKALLISFATLRSNNRDFQRLAPHGSQLPVNVKLASLDLYPHLSSPELCYFFFESLATEVSPPTCRRISRDVVPFLLGEDGTTA